MPSICSPPVALDLPCRSARPLRHPNGATRVALAALLGEIAWVAGSRWASFSPCLPVEIQSRETRGADRLREHPRPLALAHDDPSVRLAHPDCLINEIINALKSRLCSIFERTCSTKDAECPSLCLQIPCEPVMFKIGFMATPNQSFDIRINYGDSHHNIALWKDLLLAKSIQRYPCEGHLVLHFI